MKTSSPTHLSWFFCGLLSLCTLPICARVIDKIEPLFWWTGMLNPEVQLMVHGQRISDYTVSVDYPGVTIREVTKVANSNYLFITLHLGADTQPGNLILQFTQANVLFEQVYPLNARATGSAQRQGFNQQDAIYLIVPDRFANGDPSNDNTQDTLEKLQRNNPSGRHGGDLAGMIKALPYIKKMGFTQIWPTPLTENNSAKYSYHGYAATNLYRIDPRFGSNEDYRDFVANANSLGLGVIQDIVLNHIGVDHWWMRDLPDSTWINNQAQFSPTNHARTTVQDHYAAQVDNAAFTDGWFVPTMPDLNQRHPLLATYLIQNSIWWIEYAGLSGIREDTYSYADKDFLRQWAQAILAEYPQFTMVGEEWSANPLVVSYWQKGKNNLDGYLASMPSMMDFPLYYAILGALNKTENWDAGWVALYEALANDVNYPDPSKLVLFEGNHDTARVFSLLDNDFAKFSKAMVLMTTLPRIPQFFYGTEVLMQSPTQRDDGVIRSDFPGGWPGDKHNAFTTKGLRPEQIKAQTLIKTLLHYRQQNPAISQGKMTHFYPQDSIYSYVRTQADTQAGQLWVFLSKNTKSVSVDLARYAELQPEHCEFFDVLNNKSLGQLRRVTVPAHAALVLECQLH